MPRKRQNRGWASRVGRMKNIRKMFVAAVLMAGLSFGYSWVTSEERAVTRDQSIPRGRYEQAAKSAEWQQTLAPFPQTKTKDLQRTEILSHEIILPPERLRQRVLAPGAVMRSFGDWDQKANGSENSMQSPFAHEVPLEFVDPVKLNHSNPLLSWDGPVAPVGRLLRVELVNAIDSSSKQNPIMGLVTHDLFWNGVLLVPAGTEVHGTATTERARESLIADQQWQLVFMGKPDGVPNGWVLPVTAIALERQDQTGEGKSFGLSDMRLGLPGIRMQAEDYLQIKLFIANFLGAAVSSLQSKRTHLLTGTSVVEESAHNAALSGLTEVMSRFSHGVLEEIERVGFYLRIRAGTQFYLMIQEPLDLTKGNVGGERIYPDHSGSRAMGIASNGFPDIQRLQELEEELGFVWEDLWRKMIRK